MGFGGANKTEKANDQSIIANNQKLTGISTDATNRGNKTFKFFKQSAKPAMDFWKTILTGDRTAISSLLSPELSNISNQYSSAKKNIIDFTPRGGGKASAMVDLENSKAKAGIDLFNVARPMAADKLADMSSLFGNLSLGESKLGADTLQDTTKNLFGLNAQEEERRRRQAAAWASLGQGIGSIAASFFAPGVGGAGGGASGASTKIQV